tara:strand:- start:62536 stop:62898 length:363 start_codon:yes stop_codon:yes gene_type:complete
MQDIEKLSEEFFEYYKSKCKIISYNSNQKEIEEFKKNIVLNTYENELIESIISTPLIIHKAYKEKNGNYYFEIPQNRHYSSLDELLEEIFYVDIRQNAEFVERFIKEFFKYKTQEKINKF